MQKKRKKPNNVSTLRDYVNSNSGEKRAVSGGAESVGKAPKVSGSMLCSQYSG